MFKLEIQTTNAAFEDDPSYGVARLLGEAAHSIDMGHLSGSLRDINGNRVGRFEFVPEVAE